MFRISIITTISFVFYFVMSSCLVCYNQNGQNWCALEQELYIGIFGMICWIGFMSYGHFPRSSFSWCAQGPHIFWWPHGTMNTSGSLSMQMSHVTVLSSCGCVGGCSRISSSLESWYSSGVTASSLESSESVLFSRGDAVTLDDAARLRMRGGKFKLGHITHIGKISNCYFVALMVPQKINFHHTSLYKVYLYI